MRMRRFYYVGNDLSDLGKAAQDLHNAGFSEHQVHVLSQQDAELEKRRLHEVNPFAKRDILNAGLMGAAIGAVLATLILLSGVVFKAQSTLDWLPFVLLSVVVFFFSAWEGGFYGFQNSSAEFKRFGDSLARGYHVLLVDAEPCMREKIDHIMAYHASLLEAGEGAARPGWVIASQRNIEAFVKSMP